MSKDKGAQSVACSGDARHLGHRCCPTLWCAAVLLCKVCCVSQCACVCLGVYMSVVRVSESEGAKAQRRCSLRLMQLRGRVGGSLHPLVGTKSGGQCYGVGHRAGLSGEPFGPVLGASKIRLSNPELGLEAQGAQRGLKEGKCTGRRGRDLALWSNRRPRATHFSFPSTHRNPALCFSTGVRGWAA